VIVTHAPRTTLFAQTLRPEQVSEVQEQLAQWNVPFTPLADNVMVDAPRRNEILLRLSIAGVPHEHISSTEEALSSVGALTPQTVIDAQTRSGLSGDIELALRSVAGVDDARVIVAPAATAEFADESPRDASASVRLVLHPGATLSRESVAGIRSFVAASVPGLDPARVTLMDDRGVALGDRAGQSDDADGLQRSLQSALDAVLGSGASIVRVNVLYAGTASETHDVRRVPLGTAAIDRTATNEAYADASKHYQKSDEHDAKGSETHETLVQSSAGSISRVSTAVVVDAQRSLELPAIRAIAAATVGFNPHRGDSLEVEAVNFPRAPDARRDGWFLAYGAIVPLLPTLAIVVAVLALARGCTPHVVKLAAAYVERSSSARTLQMVSGYAPAHVRGALANEPPHAAAAIISALPTATAAAVLELYPQEEREAIVRRMQRANAPLIPDVAEILKRHA
jgi:flagellar biosynthesis/type III secretory pathway M-ring protein FliF/YscJ